MLLKRASKEQKEKHFFQKGKRVSRSNFVQFVRKLNLNFKFFEGGYLAWCFDGDFFGRIV